MTRSDVLAAAVLLALLLAITADGIALQARRHAARMRRELHLDQPADAPTGELNPPTRDMRTINPHDWPNR